MSARGEVPIRDAATVVLLRDGAAGVEAWMLTRVPEMVFAPGMTVFPGGRVDEADTSVPLTGVDVPQLARRFGCDDHTAHALLAAAVRELFEETGVLLSAPRADLRAAREDVELGVLGFSDLLRAHGLAADGAALHPWGRWITPAGGPRRYDTRFFVGVLPDGSEAADVTTESSTADWIPVADALVGAARGTWGLLPPTLATLVSLRAYSTVAEVVADAESRDLLPSQAKIHTDEDGTVRAELPDGSLVAIPTGIRP